MQAKHLITLPLTAVLLSLLSACSDTSTPEPLESGLMNLNIDPFAVTVSGISSGAQMAQQLHFAQSERVRGAALIGTGPYNCAQGNLNMALTQCMGHPANPPDTDALITRTEKLAQQRLLQPLEHLREDHVWLFHGNEDNTVGTPVFESAVQLYEHFVDPALLTVVRRSQTGHLWPTLEHGVDCASSEPPYLGNCNYDAAGELLAALYGYLNQPATTPGQVLPFDQQLAAGPYAQVLAAEGYAYIPKDCAAGRACSLHISFHGCNQHSTAVGDVFAQENGLNRWAETNRIVVLYPQVAPSHTTAMNPQGCWDWWGYTDSQYATLDGQQINAVVQIINHLAGVDQYLPYD